MRHAAALALILILNAACLAPELASVPDLNDNVLHLTLINGMVHAVEQGNSPATFWTPEIGLGQNIIRLYQPGAHLIVTAVYFALFKCFSVWTVFLWIRFLSLALMPLTFWFAGRLLGLPPAAQLAAAVLCCLVSGDAFGIDYGSYVWAGHGLFPQAVATHFLLLAIGLAWRSMHEKERWIRPGAAEWVKTSIRRHTDRGLFWVAPAACLVAAGYCNLFFGYIGALVILLIACMTREFRQLAKIASMGILFALPKLAAWMAAGSIAPGARSPMFDSYGAQEVLTDLFTGQTFDAGRWPVLTVLVLIGIVCAIRTGKRFLVWGFAMMLALYFGRPFWGDLLYLIGAFPSMQLHRVIGPLQIFGVFLAAGALDWVYTRIPGAYGLLAVALILSPAIQERRGYLASNAQWRQETAAAYRQDGPDLEKALALAQVRGGRAYAGLPATWGGQFKIGHVPVYSLFPVRGIPCVGYLYISVTPYAGSMYYFRDWIPEDYKTFDVRTVIMPRDMGQPPNLWRIATFGRFAAYGPR